MPHIANATAETEAEEIEVTPEMVSAGARALVTYEPMFESAEEAASRIYIEMLKAKKEVCSTR